MYGGLHPQDCRGSVPVQKKLAQNFDFSGFIPLHAMTEILVAYQLHYAGSVLKLPELQSLMDPLDAIASFYRFIPRPIYDYICGFTKTAAPTGDKVYWNLPDVAVPRGPITEDQVRTRSGTFGPISPENHNIYECYVSPYVTSEYIRVSADPTKISGINFIDWDPLPKGWFPPNGTANENFLGYRPIEALLTESMRKLCSQCEFDDGYSIKGLLCHSSRVMTLTHEAVAHCTKVEKVVPNFKKILSGDSSAFIFKEVINAVNVSAILWNETGKLKSPFSFTAAEANRADLFTYKRKRNNSAPGTCYLSDGKPPQGWLETINSNFTCSGPFTLQSGYYDREWLRAEYHEE
ncbi:hypothetical protein DOY81_000807 [Sarcophaga bullata]|nr:hypothetical protein DOY81_000807 [Sarcophaga bullata]